MELCPICRAQLGGADICRRCRAELGGVKDVERRSAALAGAALHALALGERERALPLLHRVNALKATPDIAWLLSKIEAQTAAPPPKPIPLEANETLA